MNTVQDTLTGKDATSSLPEVKIWLSFDEKWVYFGVRRLSASMKQDISECIHLQNKDNISCSTKNTLKKVFAHMSYILGF